MSQAKEVPYDFKRILSSDEEVRDYLNHPEFLLQANSEKFSRNFDKKIEIDSAVYQITKISSRQFMQSFQLTNLNRIRGLVSEYFYKSIFDQLVFLKNNEIRIRLTDKVQTISIPVEKKIYIHLGIDPYNLQKTEKSELAKVTIPFSGDPISVIIDTCRDPSKNLAVAHSSIIVRHVCENPLIVYWKNHCVDLKAEQKMIDLKITYINFMGVQDGDKLGELLGYADKFDTAERFLNYCFHGRTRGVLIQDINEQHLKKFSYEADN